MRRRGAAPRGLIVGSWMFILGALLLASSAYAAEVTASLLGTVRDASGAVVTGANISLTNTQTNVTNKDRKRNRRRVFVHSYSGRTIQTDG